MSEHSSGTMTDLAGVPLHKILLRPELDLVAEANRIMGELTGEKFGTRLEPRMLYAGLMPLTFDGYCKRLKMAIDYVPTALYRMPKGLDHLYYDPAEYAEMVEQITMTRTIFCMLNDIYVIPLIPAPDLRQYLRDQLHAATAVRPWVGSP